MSPEHFILDSHETNHFRFIYFRIPRTVLPPLSLITSTLTTKPSDFQPIKMFRRLSNSLPKDPEFPADLEKLGLIFLRLRQPSSLILARYFLNSSDQIRSIARPDQEFNFFISKNERVCEKQREAFNGTSLIPIIRIINPSLDPALNIIQTAFAPTSQPASPPSTSKPRISPPAPQVPTSQSCTLRTSQPPSA